MSSRWPAVTPDSHIAAPPWPAAILPALRRRAARLRGRLQGPRRAAWILLVLNTLAWAFLAWDAIGHGADLAAGASTTLALVGLFALVEATAVRVELGGMPITLALRATPLIVGLAFVGPVEVVAAQITGMTLGLAAWRQSPLPASARLVTSGAAGSALGAIVYWAAERATADAPVGWWLGSVLAATVLNAFCAFGAPERARRQDRVRGHDRAQARARMASPVGGAVLAGVVDASLGIIAVTFLKIEPYDVWLLVGPAVVAVAASRAWSSERRRQQRVEFLYACAQVFDGPSTGAAMLTEILQRTVEQLGAEGAEILVEESGVLLRAGISPGSAPETLVTVPRELLVQRLDLVPPGERGAILRRGAAFPGSSSGMAVLADGVVVRLESGGRMRGTLAVAGRRDGSQFTGDDLRLLEMLAANVANALAGERVPAELRASRAELAQLAALVAGTDNAFVGVGPDGAVRSWNPGAEALFGYPAVAIIGHPASVLLAQRGVGTADAFARALAGERTPNVNVDARRADGSIVPISATISPVREDGEIVGVSVIARDETTRTLQDTALRESLDRFERVFESSPVGMGVIGADLTWLRVNEALCRMLRTREAMLVGRRFESSVVRDDVSPTHGLVSRMLRGEAEGSGIQVRFRAGDEGRPVVTRFTVRPLHTPNAPPQALCMVEDITERQLAEDRARAMESQLQAARLDLTRIREPEDVLRTMLRAARELTGAESAAVLVPDTEAWGRYQTLYENDEHDLIETMIREDRLLVLTATRVTVRLPSTDTAASAPIATPGLSSLLCVPIPIEGGKEAVLILVNKRGATTFDDQDVEAVESLAIQGGITLGNARLHEQALALVRELDCANAALQEASAARSRFLANVSHELRTPLHAILLAADLLSDPAPARQDSRRRRNLPAAIEESGRYLLGLIDDLVDLSRIELSDLRMQPVEFTVGPLLADVRRQMLPLAEAKGVLLRVPVGSRIRLTADPLRIRQVLVNLVSNAIKYTAPGGSVKVSAVVDRGAPTISVRDNGAGIPAEDLERAFQPFERLGHSAVPGAGLGLPIARRITELHGGTLMASSTPGVGSTFTVRLPAMAVDGGPVTAPRTRRTRERRSTEASRVLVVDDDATVRSLMAEVLTRAGHAVDAVGSLAEARDRLADGFPALVLLDLRLDDGHGLDLVRELRADDAATDLPIITMSASAAPHEAAACLAAGVTDHLSKPIGAGELKDRVGAVVEGVRSPVPAGSAAPSSRLASTTGVAGRDLLGTGG